MIKRNLALISGTLLAAGIIGALAAPPGDRTDKFYGGDPSQIGNDDGTWHGRTGSGIRGWLGPRSVTADEYDARTRERFARLDKNSDGVIDVTEIQAVIMQPGKPRRGDMNRGERMLQQFGNKDGKITKDAFLAEAKRRFAQLDLNNDGKITDDDLPPDMRGKGVLSANGPDMPGPMGRQLAELRLADVKKDGMIALDAYMAVQTKRFEDIDRNKDGIIDKVDFDLVRQEMVAYGVKRFLHAYRSDAEGKVSKEQFYKVAKERFARLDPKGEGKITLGEVEGERRGVRGRHWFNGHRGSDQRSEDSRPSDAPGNAPKN